MDVGFDNPVFAMIEMEYSEVCMYVCMLEFTSILECECLFECMEICI